MSKNQLVALGAIAGLFLIVFLVQHLSKSEPDLVREMELQALAPDGFLVSDVSRVEVLRGPQEPAPAAEGGEEEEEEKAEKDEDETGEVVLVRGEDGWRVESAYRAPGQEDKIEEFLKKLKDLKGEYRSDDPSVLPDYDLAGEKALRVTVFRKGDGTPWFRLLVGKKEAYGRSFVRRDGEDTVYTIGVNLASEVGIWSDDKAPESSHWVDKTVVDLDKDKIERLALATPDRSLVFEKREKKVEGEGKEEDGKAAGGKAKEEKKEEKKEYEWTLAQGGPDVEFKKSGLDDVFKALDSFSATDVVDPAKKKEYGLEDPGFRCEVRLEGGKETILLASQEKPGEDAYLMVEGKDVVYKVSDWKFDDVFREGKDLFELEGLSGDKDEIRRITLAHPSGEMDFVRKDDKWTLAPPSTGLEFKENAAEDLAEDLAEWKPVDYADGESLEAFGLAAPERKVTFVVAKKGGDAEKAAERTHTISLGSEARGTEGRYALLGDDKQVWIAAKWDVEKILPEPKDFFEMDVADIEKEEIARVAVDRAETPFVLERGGDDEWKLSVGGAEVEADQGKVGTYLDRFSPVTASDVDLGRRSLDEEPAFVVRVGRKDDKPGLALRFGTERDDGKHPAQLEGKAVVLLFSSSTVENLAPPLKELADLEVADLSSGDITKITVARDADAFELAKDGETWKMSAGGEEKACDADAVSRYLRAFSGLKAADVSAAATELAPDEAGPVVTVTTKDGAAVTLRVGEEKDGKVALRREGRPLAYLVDKRGAARLAPASGSLASKDEKKEEEAPPASEKKEQPKEEAEAGAAKPE